MNKFYLPILITSLLLTSCSPKNDITVNVIKDENIIYDENKQDYKDYTVSLTLDNLSKKTVDHLLKRTKIEPKMFKKKTLTDWFLDENDALENGVIDKIVDSLDELF